MRSFTAESASQSVSSSGFRYERRKPEETDLYRIVDRYWPAFHEQLNAADVSLPTFVRKEFQSYLKCGLLEHGFVRVKCNGCRFEHLVAFSCKLRGVCPGCGARRMIETAAHLIDNVLPDVPVRQWVLTFPWPLRFLFAREPKALSRCLAVIIRAIETDLIRRAGLNRKSGAKGGTVTLIQRFGSALNLNIHTHMLILDGVYTTDDNGYIRFHPVKAPTQHQLDTLVARIIQRVIRILIRDGYLTAEQEQPGLALPDADPLDNLNAASIRYTIALGPGRGNRTLTIHDPASVKSERPVKALTCNHDGFSLNAAIACQANQRDKLERLCRYVTRPAISLERLTLRSDGQVQVQLKHPFRDGTTHLLFSPLDFIGKLVALIPRPRHNLVRYHGVLAPNATLRPGIIPATQQRERKKPADHQSHNSSTEAVPPTETLTAPLTWAQRLKRVFEIDITLCPRCGGKLRVIADITEPAVISKILNHIARAPPNQQTAPD